MANELDSLVVATLRATGSAYLPAGCISNSQVAAAAGIEASKLQMLIPRGHSEDIAVQASALTKVLHTCRAAGSVIAFEVGCLVAPTTTNTVTLDLQKSTGGGAFASILSAAITLTSATTIRVPVAGTISSAGLVDNDILALVVTLNADDTDYAKGIFAEVRLVEAYSS